MTQTFSQWFVLGAFKINQAYIAKNTCENRFRPQMHCNGNCVLMKKLKEQEKEEQNSQGSVKLEVSTVVLSSRSFFPALPATLFYCYKSSFPAFNTGNPIDRTSAIFHPPQA